MQRAATTVMRSRSMLGLQLTSLVASLRSDPRCTVKFLDDMVSGEKYPEQQSLADAA